MMPYFKSNPVGTEHGDNDIEDSVAEELDCIKQGNNLEIEDYTELYLKILYVLTSEEHNELYDRYHEPSESVFIGRKANISQHAASILWEATKNKYQKKRVWLGLDNETRMDQGMRIQLKSFLTAKSKELRISIPTSNVECSHPHYESPKEPVVADLIHEYQGGILSGAELFSKPWRRKSPHNIKKFVEIISVYFEQFEPWGNHIEFWKAPNHGDLLPKGSDWKYQLAADVLNRSIPKTVEEYLSNYPNHREHQGLFLGAYLLVNEVRNSEILQYFPDYQFLAALDIPPTNWFPYLKTVQVDLHIPNDTFVID